MTRLAKGDLTDLFLRVRHQPTHGKPLQVRDTSVPRYVASRGTSRASTPFADTWRGPSITSSHSNSSTRHVRRATTPVTTTVRTTRSPSPVRPRNTRVTPLQLLGKILGLTTPTVLEQDTLRAMEKAWSKSTWDSRCGLWTRFETWSAGQPMTPFRAVTFLRRSEWVRRGGSLLSLSTKC